jgi:hypothetical protein
MLKFDVKKIIIILVFLIILITLSCFMESCNKHYKSDILLIIELLMFIPQFYLLYTLYLELLFPSKKKDIVIIEFKLLDPSNSTEYFNMIKNYIINKSCYIYDSKYDAFYENFEKLLGILIDIKKVNKLKFKLFIKPLNEQLEQKIIKTLGCYIKQKDNVKPERLNYYLLTEKEIREI